MARLNDPQPPGGESIEALKKRYIRQNREIARVNSGQSIRIRTLETEAAQLLEENIALREQVIKLTVELDRRDRSAELLENVSNTKRVLEKKVQEMLTLVGTLGLQAHMEKKDKIVTAPKPVEERMWKNEYLVKVEQEGLASIKEDSVYPRKSLSMEDVPILSPTHSYTPQEDNDSDNELPEPPFSAYLDMRPRRRRDSSFINTATTKLSPSKSSPLNLPIRTSKSASPPAENKPPKRKFEFEEMSPEPRLSFGGEAVEEPFTFRVPEKREKNIPTASAEAAADEVLRRLSSEPWSKVEEGNRRLSGGSESGESLKENKPAEERRLLAPVPMEPVEERRKRISLAGVSGNLMPVLAPPERKDRFEIEEVGEIDFAPKPRKSSSSALAPAPRKALGTKTANVGPMKQPLLGEKNSDPSLKSSKSLDLNPEKPPVKDIATDGPENDARSSENGRGRASRRASAQPVNYVLPRLNTKLRREAAEPEKTKKPRISSSTSRRARERESSVDRTSRATSVESEIAEFRREGDADGVVTAGEWAAPRQHHHHRDEGSRRRSTSIQDVYAYPISSPEKVARGVKSAEAGEGERDGEGEDAEEGEGEGRVKSREGKRLSVAFEGPEEREKGRSSFGGSKADRRRTMMV